MVLGSDVTEIIIPREVREGPRGSPFGVRTRVIAEKRLELLERRLERESQLKVKYTETIENDLQNGYIKKLEDQELVETDAREWYLPHHAVVHPHKPGKVRRVSDAAARCQGISLNDCLSSGPDLLNSLAGILMRFRQELVAVSADIEAMFNQVVVPKDDKVVLRFLWRKNPSDKDVSTSTLDTSLVQSVPLHVPTTQDNTAAFPLETEAVRRNFYMDDLFKSESSL